jgi:hypothetical protein
MAVDGGAVMVLGERDKMVVDEVGIDFMLVGYTPVDSGAV